MEIDIYNRLIAFNIENTSISSHLPFSRDIPKTHYEFIVNRLCSFHMQSVWSTQTISRLSFFIGLFHCEQFKDG